MKKQKGKKLWLDRETVRHIDNTWSKAAGGGSENRACATYTEIIGPCVDTYRGC